MPEGPEIRRAADKIEAVLKDQVIEDIAFGLPRLKRYAAQLRGHRVTHIETRGKALLTHFDNGLAIYSHNQLYGVWQTCKRGKLPATKRQLRLALHTAANSALLYSASDISVWQQDALDEHPFLARIGPDILAPALTWQDVAKRLRSKAFAGRSLSALYLDQQFLAGLGNYLRSEILFAAGIDPAARPKDLNQNQLNKLARQTLSVSHRSYKSGGVTLPDKQYRWLRNEGLNHAQARFMVFGRANLPCHVCGTKIKRSEAGARRIYRCADCQPSG